MPNSVCDITCGHALAPSQGQAFAGAGLAVVLPTLLGAASAAVGHDRLLQTNTAKRRTHSLFRQGCVLYDLIPTMPESRLRPLLECFGALLEQQPLFTNVFGAV